MSVASNLDRYRTLSVLGAGGMATVHLAEDELLGRRVALKRMSTEDVRGLSRLRREALLGASISHPNLVGIYDVVDDDAGGLVIVMEYVEGETLGQRITREGKLAPAEALRILDGVAAGLDAIHQQGIVHRDVKPPNILLGSGDTVKLADLGIASVPERTRITSAGMMLGSFRYMAPEQLDEGPVTPALDVYALSAVAFEALSGQKARQEPNPMALAYAISTSPPPDLRERWPEAPRAAADVLKRGLALEPAQRPASAGELVRRLRAAFEPARTAAIPPPRAARPAPRGAVAVGPATRPTRQATRATPGPPPVADGEHRSRAGIWAALLALVAAAAVLAIVLSGGNDPKPRHTASTARAAHHARAKHATGSKTAAASSRSSAAPAAAPAAKPATQTAANRGTAPPAGSGSAASPTSAVQSFYSLAAAHRYADAWALADPAFRNQLGGYSSFQAGQSGDKSITFRSIRTVSRSAGAATVALATTSVRTDGTHQCQGTADLVSGSASGWLVHQIHINCT